MSKEKEFKKLDLFFPYYVNQGRLLDIYAILNGGYSDYSEIITEINKGDKNGSTKEVGMKGGFKLFKLGGTVEQNSDRSNSHINKNTEKKVQTVTSMLSIVINTLADKGYLQDIKESEPGQFVCIPINLSINSIKSLLSEISDLLNLMNNMKNLGVNVNGVRKQDKEIDKLLKNIRVLFDGEEILDNNNDDYAIIGNIVDSNLYQAARSDIIGSQLKCLAQVKRVFPHGSELMKNTIFTKIKDNSAKKSLIDAVTNIQDSEVFDFEAVATPMIENKPVYQLEIIALYQ